MSDDIDDGDRDDLGLGGLFRPLAPPPGGAEDASRRGRRHRARRWAGLAGAGVVAAALVAVLAVALPGSGNQTVTVGDSATTVVAPSSTSSTVPSTTTTVVGGSVTSTTTGPGSLGPPGPLCTSEAIQSGVAAALGPSAHFSVVSFGCSGAYAYADVTVQAPAGSLSKLPGITETLLLTLSNGAWTQVQQSAYCTSGSVPTSIYQPACTSN